MGIEPTGEEVEVMVVASVRVDDGKPVEEWQLVDVHGLGQQLGVVEPPTG